MGVHVNRLKWCQPNFFTSVIPVKKIQLDEKFMSLFVFYRLCVHIYSHSQKAIMKVMASLT